MKRYTLWIAVGMLILAALACGRSTPVPPTAELPTAVPPTAQPPTAIPPVTSPTKAPSGMVELILENQSGLPVCYIYISSVQEETWGDNWLPQNEMVPSGSRRVFQVAEGTYDLRADDCNNNLVDIHYEVQLAGQMTWSLDPIQRAPVLIVNNSSHEICYLYISPADSEDWGPDWMGQDSTIPAGTNRTLQVPLGTYDLRADDCEGNPLDIQNGIPLEADGITWTLKDVEEASLELINNLDIPICYVFISPAESDEWGADWLGDDTVPPGGSYSFYLPAGTYDLSARDCNGDPVSEEVYGQEIRGEMTWTIQP